jgi:hypothetical protein
VGRDSAHYSADHVSWFLNTTKSQLTWRDWAKFRRIIPTNSHFGVENLVGSSKYAYFRHFLRCTKEAFPRQLCSHKIIRSWEEWSTRKTQQYLAQNFEILPLVCKIEFFLLLRIYVLCSVLCRGVWVGVWVCIQNRKLQLFRILQKWSLDGVKHRVLGPTCCHPWLFCHQQSHKASIHVDACFVAIQKTLQSHLRSAVLSRFLIALGSNHLDLVVATTSCCNDD